MNNIRQNPRKAGESSLPSTHLSEPGKGHDDDALACPENVLLDVTPNVLENIAKPCSKITEVEKCKSALRERYPDTVTAEQLSRATGVSKSNIYSYATRCPEIKKLGNGLYQWQDPNQIKNDLYDSPTPYHNIHFVRKGGSPPNLTGLQPGENVILNHYGRKIWFLVHPDTIELRIGCTDNPYPDIELVCLFELFKVQYGLNLFDGAWEGTLEAGGDSDKLRLDGLTCATLTPILESWRVKAYNHAGRARLEITNIKTGNIVDLILEKSRLMFERKMAQLMKEQNRILKILQTRLDEHLLLSHSQEKDESEPVKEPKPKVESKTKPEVGKVEPGSKEDLCPQCSMQIERGASGEIQCNCGYQFLPQYQGEVAFQRAEPSGNECKSQDQHLGIKEGESDQ